MSGKNFGFQTTAYADDRDHIKPGHLRIKRTVVVGFQGVTYRVPVNPGKRPRRKKGESPLD